MGGATVGMPVVTRGWPDVHSHEWVGLQSKVYTTILGRSALKASHAYIVRSIRMVDTRQATRD